LRPHAHREHAAQSQNQDSQISNEPVTHSETLSHPEPMVAESQTNLTNAVKVESNCRAKIAYAMSN
jgi:hypothetical protein